MFEKVLTASEIGFGINVCLIYIYRKVYCGRFTRSITVAALNNTNIIVEIWALPDSRVSEQSG